MKWKCLLTMISIVMLISCKSAAQQPTVPDIILKRFAILYPTHKNLTWELENGNYEAEFIKGEKEMTVVFEPDGAVAQTETVSDTTAIPQSIKDYVKTNMAGHDITEVTYIADAYGNNTWEIEINKEDYIFSTDGQLIGKAPHDPDDKEDDQ